MTNNNDLFKVHTYRLSDDEYMIIDNGERIKAFHYGCHYPGKVVATMRRAIDYGFTGCLFFEKDGSVTVRDGLKLIPEHNYAKAFAALKALAKYPERLAKFNETGVNHYTSKGITYLEDRVNHIGVEANSLCKTLWVHALAKRGGFKGRIVYSGTKHEYLLRDDRLATERSMTPRQVSHILPDWTNLVLNRA